MKKNKLVWRLSKMPTPEEVRGLVKDKIIAQEEAKEILFSSDGEKERDEKSLKEEIKFLRNLVDKLSNSSTINLVETIRTVDVPYRRYSWYRPYDMWCANDDKLLCASMDSKSSAEIQSFSNITTF